MRTFLIDTDTASDDAVALVMALKHPDVQVEAITVVGGNVPREQGVQNALYTVELCGASVPVYAGAAQPLLRPLATAQSVHGQDGMGDIGLPLRGRSPAGEDGVSVIVETIRRHAGRITVVTLGPLTNLALALRLDPSLADKVERCVVMGGVGYGYGNVTPVAEYNLWVDPEAAKIVFEAGLPLTMVGWDLSRLYAVFEPQDAEEIRTLGTELAHFCMDGLRADRDTPCWVRSARPPGDGGRVRAGHHHGEPVTVCRY
jgi:purine nucleosidase